MAKNVLKNLGRALEIGANVGSAFASRSPKKNFLIITWSDKIFTTRATGCTLWNLCTLYSKNGTEKQTDYTQLHHLKVKRKIYNGDYKKLNDINSFSNSIKNIKELVTYFKDKEQKIKKEI